MRDVAGRLTGVMAVIASLSAPLPAAEQAWRTDGRRVSGALVLEKGQLYFSLSPSEALPLADITRIRFAEMTPPPLRIGGGGRRIRLCDGQWITGQLLGLNKDKLTLRTAWADRIELPRSSVASLDPLPGWRIVDENDFRTGLNAFTTTGEPIRTEAGAEQEPPSVLLREVGQSVVYTLATSIEAGRVGINFRERNQASGARWVFEMLFREGKHSRRVSVRVAGEGESYSVDAEGLKGVVQRMAKTPGWHRLTVQFTKRSLSISCDEKVLWYSLEQGPGGRLKEVTWRCHKFGDAAVHGMVAWSEFCLERAVGEYPNPPAEAEQDEVRLVNDDQLFGQILQADRRTIQIEGRFGKRSLRWSEVAGCLFRRAAVTPRAIEGGYVQLLVHSGFCPEVDVLKGVVRALDERHLTLRHALLGDLTFERSRVRELRPLSGGPK